MAERMVKRNLKEDDVLQSKSNKEDDVLSMIDAELDISSSKKKGKRSSSVKATPSTSKTSVATCGTSSDPKSLDKTITGIDGNIVMEMLQSIKENQKKQDDKLESLTDKVNEMYDNEYDEYDDENDDLDLEPQAKKARSDGNNNDVQDTIKESEQ
ncbi:unnamed protein product [Mytilus edulis]|uniref:Uncharacterized protein n=1 Tax=Mytilus edulis TaxID=6550 RepID=A0A8S3VAT0_MYTED|nr:unnamed protein product [Mytilus edulis]